jgi:galactoside O-acetyltransferase
MTRDIPADSVAYGNPCRAVRKIGERDRETFFRDEKIDWDEIEKNYR